MNHPRETEDERPDYPTEAEWRAMQEPPDDMWVCTDEEACARLAEIWFGGEQMTTLEKIRALSPCPEGLARAVECGTLREWWGASTTRSDMTWLVGKAHSRGTLPRRRLVHMAVRCCETVAHVMPPDALPLLADVAAWCGGGADDIDLRQVRDALWLIRRAAAAAYDAAAYDAAAAYAAAYDAAAYAYAADADAAAAAAAAYAAYASCQLRDDGGCVQRLKLKHLLAYADDAAAAAMCDVIRDALEIDEVCAALGLDPDEVLT